MTRSQPPPQPKLLIEVDYHRFSTFFFLQTHIKSFKSKLSIFRPFKTIRALIHHTVITGLAATHILLCHSILNDLRFLASFLKTQYFVWNKFLRPLCAACSVKINTGKCWKWIAVEIPTLSKAFWKKRNLDMVVTVSIILPLGEEFKSRHTGAPFIAKPTSPWNQKL